MVTLEILDCGGRWIVHVWQAGALIVRAHAPGHDPSNRAAMQVAATFCRNIVEATTAGVVRRRDIATKVREVLRAAKPAGKWGLTFTLVAEVDSAWSGFTCGGNTIGAVSSRGWRIVVRPQTWASSLEDKGNAEPPALTRFLELVRGTAACTEEDIVALAVPDAHAETLVVCADPRVADAVALAAEGRDLPSGGAWPAIQPHLADPTATDRLCVVLRVADGVRGGKVRTTEHGS